MTKEEIEASFQGFKKNLYSNYMYIANPSNYQAGGAHYKTESSAISIKTRLQLLREIQGGKDSIMVKIKATHEIHTIEEQIKKDEKRRYKFNLVFVIEDAIIVNN